MKPDFSGWATKANLKCSDGRTIMPNAFQHQDKMQVPLVWMHGHLDPENVLGHAILQNRQEGVWLDAYFNNTPKGQHTKESVNHGDIKALSIWANQLIQRAKNVIHGSIREVSLVLSGANPGALIESVTLHHEATDTDEYLEDEAIIHTGLEIELDTPDPEEVEAEEERQLELAHSADDGKVESEVKLEEKKDEVVHADGDGDLTVEDVYNTMNEQQQNVLHYMISEALKAGGGEIAQSAMTIEHDDDDTPEQIIETMDDKQKEALQYMVGQAVEETKEAMAQSGINDSNQEGNNTMTNVFEKGAEETTKTVLSHDDMKGIVSSASRSGSLKSAVEEYCIAHGITDIDTLFPDAQAIDNMPEWNKRRTEWVAEFIGATRKSPFSRVKTFSADLTMDDARAKGYVTGAMKKEEFFTVSKRVTTPTTIYKKQALDRDDILDLADFDVVAWLKVEMRFMLDEELARAMLVGDGRDISDEDKINEQNIRPIATDHELYTTTVTVNVSDASSSMNEVLDAVLVNRYKLKGTGVPNFYTTEYWIARFLLLRDGDQKRMYRNLDELATELRVGRIIAVEALVETPEIVGVMVNPVDYVLGADKGGQVSLFDDFDIDYNKQKYLIETRVSGALTKLKSAMVIMSTAAANVLATPTQPAFVPATGVITIPTVTGVVYKNAAGTTLVAGAQTALAAGASLIVNATPASGYYFGTSDEDTWTFTRNP